jgi:hypothetical protein
MAKPQGEERIGMTAVANSHFFLRGLVGLKVKQPCPLQARNFITNSQALTQVCVALSFSR